MAETKTKTKRYVVVPRTNEGYKEKFAKSGPRAIPFGVPVELTEKDLLQLNNQKEAVKSTGAKNPYEIAREKGITIDKAMDMLEKMGDTISSASEILWRNKYDIHPA